MKQSLLGCLLGVAIGVPAFAQSGSSQYPSCPDPPPKLTQAEQDAAHASYKVGVEAFKDSDYQKAIDNFKDAFRRDCSKVSLLDFIARSYEGKGDRAEAVHALETYLQRNPKADDAETIQRRIQNLKAQMGSSSATSPTTSATTPATATTAPSVTATASATGTAPPPETGGHTIFPWIVMGVGVVAIGAAVPVGIIGQNKQAQAREGCDPGTTNNCNPTKTTPNGVDRSQLSSTGATMSNVGWILGGVGAAALIGGLVWHFVEPSAKKVALVPVFGPSYGGLSFTGRF